MPSESELFYLPHIHPQRIYCQVKFNSRHSLLPLILVLFCLSVRATSEWVAVDFALPVAQTNGTHTVIIPFTLAGGLILLDARVGEGLGKCILDTGANGLVLNDQYIRPDYLLSNIEGMGVGGETADVGTKRLPDFGIEELAFPGVIAQTVDLRHLEDFKKMRILGLIGYDLLKDFEIMINYQENFLTLSRVDQQGKILDPLPHTLDKMDSLYIDLADFLPVIEVQVAGKTKRMGIDTGAEYNLLDIKRSKNILDKFKVLKKTKVIAANDDKVEVLAGKLYGMSFKKKFRNPGMYSVLTNFKQLDRLYGERLDGILGFPFLMRWTISLNYRQKKLYIHQPKFVRP